MKKILLMLCIISTFSLGSISCIFGLQSTAVKIKFPEEIYDNDTSTTSHIIITVASSIPEGVDIDERDSDNVITAYNEVPLEEGKSETEYFGIRWFGYDQEVRLSFQVNDSPSVFNSGIKNFKTQRLPYQSKSFTIQAGRKHILNWE